MLESGLGRLCTVTFVVTACLLCYQLGRQSSSFRVDNITVSQIHKVPKDVHQTLQSTEVANQIDINKNREIEKMVQNDGSKIYFTAFMNSTRDGVTNMDRFANVSTAELNFRSSALVANGNGSKKIDAQYELAPEILKIDLGVNSSSNSSVHYHLIEEKEIWKKPEIVLGGAPNDSHTTSNDRNKNFHEILQATNVIVYIQLNASFGAEHVEGVLENAKLLKSIFPGWGMHVYYSGVLPNLLMQEKSIDFVNLKPDENFLNISSGISRLCFRSLDSRLSYRERAAVDDWINSGEPFHVMRDHPSHSIYNVPVGLWCASRVAENLMFDSYEKLVASVDQESVFMKDDLWKLMSLTYNVRQHDSISCEKFPGSIPFPTLRRGREFVGSKIVNGKMQLLSNLPIPKQCETKPPPRYFSADGEGHGHRDCRYSSMIKGDNSVRERLVILISAWARFCELHSVEQWIAHGTLLGWYWGKTIMDFDDDLDIEVTGTTMLSTLLSLNGTVFEGRFLLDLNPSGLYPHDDQPVNGIDAEFVDMQGGHKIDITSFRKGIKGDTSKVVASDGHYMFIKDLFPLQESTLDGVHVWVPRNPSAILEEEYHRKGLTTSSFNGWTFTSDEWINPKSMPSRRDRFSPIVFESRAEKFYIPWDLRTQFADRWNNKKTPNEMNAQINSQLIEVDVDNHISPIQNIDVGGKKNLRVIEFNIERGAHWKEAAKLIESAGSADIVFINEADWGMARSGNDHVARLIAYKLKMNYAWGIEFLELTPGNKAETESALHAIDCPTGRRGVNFKKKIDALGLHGNAILSKFPLRNVHIVRMPGIDHLYNTSMGTQITAGGYENRLGGRMVIYATATLFNQSIHLGCFHHQMLWDRGENLKLLGKPTIESMRMEHESLDPSGKSRFILAGDGWGTKWCNDIGFKIMHDYTGGDWICSRGFSSGLNFKRFKSTGISDHDMFAIDLHAPDLFSTGPSSMKDALFYPAKTLDSDQQSQTSSSANSSKNWTDSLENIWISIGLCIDEVVTKSGKKPPYKKALLHAVKLWKKIANVSTIVTLVASDINNNTDPVLQALDTTDTIVRRVQPDKSVGCITTAQIERMYAYKSGNIRDNDMIVMSDADAFPISSHVLDPLKESPDMRVWIWQHKYSEDSGFSFPMSLIGMRASDWQKYVGVKTISEYWNQRGLLPDGKWGFDQQIVTQSLLKNKICSAKNSVVWKRMGLVPAPWDDSKTCFHGSIEHCHTGAGGKYWKHMTVLDNVDQVASTITANLDKLEKGIKVPGFLRR